MHDLSHSVPLSKYYQKYQKMEQARTTHKKQKRPKALCFNVETGALKPRAEMDWKFFYAM